MKKIIAILLAMVMVLSLAVAVSADEIVVFDNPDGESFSDCINPWDFFGIGGFWGRQAATVLDISIEEIKDMCEEGGATFTYVFSGGNPSEAPNLVFEFSDPQSCAKCTVTDLGDGKYEATGALDDLVAMWESNGRTMDEVANFLIQPWVGNIVVYSAKFNTGADAVVSAPVVEDVPTTQPDAAPVEEAPAAETPVAAPANTGIVLAVLPMAIAAAAVVASKRR